MRHATVFHCEAVAAVTTWIPPDGTIMSPDLDDELASWLRGELRSQADVVLEAFERFEAAMPAGAYWYLGLFGTHPAHRGRGVGMALLRENLAMIDAAHAPAYLESTNPVNDARYEAVGFAEHGGFEMPDGGPRVRTMWREPR